MECQDTAVSLLVDRMVAYQPQRVGFHIEVDMTCTICACVGLLRYAIITGHCLPRGRLCGALGEHCNQTW